MMMNEQPAAVTQISENTTASTAAQARNCPAKDRKKYSGNHILRLINALKSAKLDMEREHFSMNGIVHIAQEEIEDLMQTHQCDYADIAQIFADNGSPVSERTLKDYLAQARKDAREGRTSYSKVRQVILESGGQQESQDIQDLSGCQDDAEAFSAGENDTGLAEQSSFDDFATPDNNWLAASVSHTMDAIDEKNSKAQHVQDFYAARKRRKKAQKDARRR